MKQPQLLIIKEFVEELLHKMTIEFSSVNVELVPLKHEDGLARQAAIPKDTVGVNITMDDPQILIGHNGQTLADVERLLKIAANKKVAAAHPGALGNDFYVMVDINNYKEKKMAYLKDLAVTLADQVVLEKQEKSLPPMPSYERRIVHAQLAQRPDVLTESQGEGMERHVVIKSR